MAAGAASPSQTAPLGATGAPVPLTPVEVTPRGTSYGTPSGMATVSYNPAAQKLTVTVSASGLAPGMHAAHIHIGSCASQGPVRTC
jgi:Cu/Zn superoxide dismutase